jgi:hypothetical protein
MDDVVEFVEDCRVNTFRVGQIWRSTNLYLWRVEYVSTDSVATLKKLGPGWSRTAELRWDRLGDWEFVEYEQPPAPKQAKRHAPRRALAAV